MTSIAAPMSFDQYKKNAPKEGGYMGKYQRTGNAEQDYKNYTNQAGFDLYKGNMGDQQAMNRYDQRNPGVRESMDNWYRENLHQPTSSAGQGANMSVYRQTKQSGQNQGSGNAQYSAYSPQSQSSPVTTSTSSRSSSSSSPQYASLTMAADSTPEQVEQANKSWMDWMDQNTQKFQQSGGGSTAISPGLQRAPTGGGGGQYFDPGFQAMPTPGSGQTQQQAIDQRNKELAADPRNYRDSAQTQQQAIDQRNKELAANPRNYRDSAGGGGQYFDPGFQAMPGSPTYAPFAPRTGGSAEDYGITTEKYTKQDNSKYNVNDSAWQDYVAEKNRRQRNAELFSDPENYEGMTVGDMERLGLLGANERVSTGPRQDYSDMPIYNSQASGGGGGQPSYQQSTQTTQTGNSTGYKPQGRYDSTKPQYRGDPKQGLPSNIGDWTDQDLDTYSQNAAQTGISHMAHYYRGEDGNIYKSGKSGHIPGPETMMPKSSSQQPQQYSPEVREKMRNPDYENLSQWHKELIAMQEGMQQPQQRISADTVYGSGARENRQIANQAQGSMPYEEFLSDAFSESSQEQAKRSMIENDALPDFYTDKSGTRTAVNPPQQTDMNQVPPQGGTPYGSASHYGTVAEGHKVPANAKGIERRNAGGNEIIAYTTPDGIRHQAFLRGDGTSLESKYGVRDSQEELMEMAPIMSPGDLDIMQSNMDDMGSMFGNLESSPSGNELPEVFSSSTYSESNAPMTQDVGVSRPTQTSTQTTTRGGGGGQQYGSAPSVQYTPRQSTSSSSVTQMPTIVTNKEQDGSSFYNYADNMSEVAAPQADMQPQQQQAPVAESQVGRRPVQQQAPVAEPQVDRRPVQQQAPVAESQVSRMPVQQSVAQPQQAMQPVYAEDNVINMAPGTMDVAALAQAYGNGTSYGQTTGAEEAAAKQQQFDQMVNDYQGPTANYGMMGGGFTNDFGGAMAQRDAFINRINEARRPAFANPGSGEGRNLDFGALLEQAGEDVQGGFQNPFSSQNFGRGGPGYR